MTAPEPLSLRQRLPHWLDHLEHVLPAQGPIRDFVHHNTLHGFQHLPFAEAVAAAQALTGARAYPEEAVFHAHFAAGRITVEDLDAALEDAGVADLEAPVVRGLTRRDVLRAALLEPADLPAPARLAWALRETALAADPLWQAAASLLPAPPAARAGWRAEAAATWAGLAARLGREWSLRALLAHLTGEDVLATVRTVLQRHLAAHLDLGQAAWHNPARGQGFYAAWRASAAADFAWDLDELPNVREELAWLPDDPVDLLAQELPALVPDPGRHYGFLQRLALELPGWSGMLLRRERHGPREDGVPVSLADYLAVRVLLERLLSEDAIRRLAGGPLSPAELVTHFAARPGEVFVRHALAAGALSEDLAQCAHSLRQAAERGPVDEGAWAALADAIAAAAADAGGFAGAAWRLAGLARRLGLAAGDLLHLGEEGAAALVHTAGSLDALARGEVWLLAFERRYREQLFAALAANRGRGRSAGPAAVQAVFCMDDREEGLRRHLEEIAPAVDTYGAAGFFGIAMAWRGVDDAADTALCPVVVRPAHRVVEAAVAGGEVHARRRQWRLAWRERFVQGTRRQALTAPLLTAAAAPVAAAALAGFTLAPGWLGETLARWRRQFDGVPATRLAVTAAAGTAAGTPEAPREGFSDDEQAERVAAFLAGIGLTAGFAPLVAIVGHGSGSRNNPHLAAYDCGACSGRHGGPNARVFATLANRPAVRSRLAARGIAVPDGTWFVAAEHNTCDDGLLWYDGDQVPPDRQAEFDRFVGQLNEAARTHAAERCRRFAAAPPRLAPWPARAHVAARRHDLAEARPELGHATNAAAIIGRRCVSRGLFLDRRIFLISYDPTADDDGRIAEGILLAAGPVGAGIALEYYFSTADNERYGCGSKITHNLTGLFGVQEGADSDLRTGLPRQMIEVHEPMRLLVVVEQAPAVLSAILARQPALQELVGNGWIVLAACAPADGALHRYCPRRGWLPWTGKAVLPRVARSADWFAGEDGPLPPALVTGGAA